MQNKIILFFRNKQEINLDFLADNLSSDGGLIISEKIERESKLLRGFSKLIPDKRHSSYVHHTLYKMLKQRVYLLNQGYEDCNDEKRLRHDPLLHELSDGRTVSQPTMSRFENSLGREEIYKMSEYFVDNWIDSIPMDKDTVIIDVDSTDLETHGHQQLSMFNDFYKESMYNPLMFHDGDTGQLILPVLRAGNVHTSRGFTALLKGIVERLRSRRPQIKIIIRGDSGFSGASFYKLAEEYDLKFCVGIAGNAVLQSLVKCEEECITGWFYNHGEDYQYFTDKIEYKANSWDMYQYCYAKIESTRYGINKRFFCSNLYGRTAKELYNDFYVKRGDRSENRIKELKCMCFSGRLSCHEFYANYFRLFLSALSYEMFRIFRNKIRATGNIEASKWQVANIRLFLLKVGAVITKKVKTLTVSFSKSYVCKKLLTEMLI